MDMEKFESALDTVIKQFGKKIITEKRFVSVLSDYNAFYDTPAIRSVMIVCVQEGFFKSINDIINKKFFFYGNDKRLKDAVLCVEKYRLVIKKKVGDDVLVDQVTDIFMREIFPNYASRKVGAASIAPNNKCSDKRFVRYYEIVKDSFTLLLILCSVCAVIAGNAIYVMSENNEWWMRSVELQFSSSTIIQTLLLVPIGMCIKKRGNIAKGLFLSVLIVAIFNTLMPLFLKSQIVADFYSNFTWDYDGETLYNLYKGQTTVDDDYVIICVIILLVFMLMLYVTNSNKFQDLLRFMIKMRFVILIGVAIVAVAFVPYLFISASSYIKYYKESGRLESRIQSEIMRVKKIGDERKAKNVNLSFMGIELGTSITSARSIALNDESIYDVSELMTGYRVYKYKFGDVHEDDVQYPECSNFMFKTTLSLNEVEVYVNAYKDVIYNIGVYLGDDRFERIYSEKYGEPTRDSSYIKQEMDTRSYNYYVEHLFKDYQKSGYADLEDEYQEVDDNLYWIFKNNSITMSKGGFKVTYTYDEIHQKAELYKKGVTSKVEKEIRRKEIEQARKEIEQARKDSIEDAIRKKEIIMQENAAKIKEFNDI